MNFSQLTCPNCNICFKDNIQYYNTSNNIVLDKIYYYDVYSFICEKCKKQIRAFICNDIKPILWCVQQQYYYNDFVINKNNRIISNKKYLYFYFPNNKEQIVNKIIKLIDFSNIDVVVTNQQLSQYIFFEKQLCILPDSIFAPNQNNILPNMFAEKIIQRQLQKFQNSTVFSTYYNFSNNFNLIYKINDWNKIKN